tara:strand:- start:24 stop:227 length:204 start_codon:yes stop_codon:yes gene_type:complete
MSSLDISNNNNINEPGIDPEFLELMREKEAADKLWFKETQKIANKELEEFEKAWAAEGFLIAGNKGK